MNCVERSAPLTRTTDVETKSEPVRVRVSSPLPCSACAGERAVMPGAGLAGAGAVPSPQLAHAAMTAKAPDSEHRLRRDAMSWLILRVQRIKLVSIGSRRKFCDSADICTAADP